jgi:hypothetical protein
LFGSNVLSTSTKQLRHLNWFSTRVSFLNVLQACLLLTS